MNTMAFQVATPRAVATPVFTAATTTVALQPAAVAPSTLAATAATPTYTAQIANLRYIDPDFATRIVNLVPATNGVPREQIHVPISSNENVADTLVYDDPADASKHYYLPRYELAQTQDIVGQAIYAIRFAPDTSGGTTLSVELKKTIPPEVAAAAAAGAAELPHKVAVILRAGQMVAGTATVYDEYAFSDVIATDHGVHAVLHLATLADRDAVYRALTELTSGAALVVRRAITVAIPAAAGPSAPMVMHPIFMRSPLLVEDDGPRPVDRAMWIRPTPAPPVPLFRQVDRAVDVAAPPAPFNFPPTLYGYVYEGIAAPSGGSALAPETLDYHGQTHTYFRRPQTNKLYYLPDAFKVARRPNTPHAPMMAIHLNVADAPSATDPLAGLTVTLEYIAVPYTDPARLDAAAALLRRGSDPVEYAPLMVKPESLKLQLALPPAGDGGGENPNRSGKATVDLRSGIHDALTVSGQQFAALYAALFGGSLLVLTGSVTVDLGGSMTCEPIPFEARMNDLIGTVCDVDVRPHGDGSFAVTLTNGIESAIALDAPRVTVRTPDHTVTATLSGATFPVELAPAGTLALTVTSGAAPADVASLSIDVQPVARVKPDSQAIYDTILDPSAPQMFAHPISVSSSPALFASADADPTTSVVIDFPLEPSVTLDAKTTTAPAMVRSPVRDILLGVANFLNYTYSVRGYRKSGALAFKNENVVDHTTQLHVPPV